MEELSILKKSASLVQSQASINEVEKNQLSAAETMTKALQVVADRNLAEGKKMALISEIMGYVQIASLFLGPLLIVSGILAAGGTLTSLLGEATISGIEGATQLTQGVLAGTEGALDATSTSIKSDIQKNTVATTTLQKNIDDILESAKEQSDRARQQTAMANKVLNNDARIGRQKTVQ